MGKEVNETKQIFDAVENGSTEMVKQLIGGGVDVNTRDENGLPLLSAAVSRGNAEIVEFLLASGADANAEDDETFVPLHYAVRNGQTEIVKMLLENGADAKKAERMGLTPFGASLLTVKEDCTMAAFLLENGVDINAVCDRGYAEIHFFSALRGTAHCVKFLLENGADVNVKNTVNGATALHFAVKKSNIETAELLLANGADVNAVDEENLTPLHYCARYIDGARQRVRPFFVRQRSAAGRRRRGGSAFVLFGKEAY